MKVTHQFYDIGRKEIIDGNINWKKEKIRIALLYAPYEIFNPQHNLYEDVSRFEINYRDYQQGGKILKKKQVIDISKKRFFLANDIIWHGSFAANGAIIYHGNEIKILLSYMNFGCLEYSIEGKFHIIWDDNAIYSTKYKL